MADNIKIVGAILNTQQVTRYESSDLNLFSSTTLQRNFGEQNDYIEYIIYNATGDSILIADYNYKSFKLPTTSYVNPINSSLPIIEIDPIKDLQNSGFESGEFKVRYNFFTNQISDPLQSGLFIKEISSDRTEIRVSSTLLSNAEIEGAALNIINSYNSSPYFIEYILNFGNDIQSLIVNTALDKSGIGYEILFKLYQPLPDSINVKSTFWVVKEKVDPYIFDINLDKLITPPTGSQLRGPNFAIDIPNQNNIATSYQTYADLINDVQSTSSSSYQQLLNLITSQSVDINTDYTNFNNFVIFSSAKQRIINFYNKVKDIEDYNNNIATYTPLIASNPSVIKDYNLATSSINNIISNFDGFEYYLYFESGSTLTSSVEYNITPYPKTGSLLPYPLLSTSSIKVQEWYSWATASADSYDDNNSNNLIYTVPSFIKDDGNNIQYLTFLNMMGHYFDNIWVYLQGITDINLANNNLEKGVSKDLVYYVLESLGTKLYNKYGNSDNVNFLIGNNGSASFDNNFTFTGSYLNAVPRKDLLAESYKRIYHNLPLLLKTKGTAYGLQTLISVFGISNLPYSTSFDANLSASYWYTTLSSGNGITGSVLRVKEYGGDLKSNTLDEFNNDKIRVVNTTITGSVLSPYISLTQYPTSSTSFRTNDLNYVDISFSPQDKIDIYTSASIAVASPNWSIDTYIGDPGYLYSSSYATLNTQKDIYLSPLSASKIPFSASSVNGAIGATNYNDFIRLIQFFDNSLFKMIKDYIPARVNLSTGITISSPILERNRFVYANPTPTSKIEVNEGTIEGPTIGTEYTDIYQYLTGSRAAYYTGEFEGDSVNYNDIFNEVNFNPYLQYNASSWNSLYPNDPINPNSFAHSNFNVLFNNVSSSRLSTNRKSLEAIYTMNSPLRLAGYSSSYYAELQDSYETSKTHQLSRYEGVKISSLKYNTYTSASSDYNGDISFGKEATINKNVRKLGLFVDIVSSSFLPGRNRASLKYLVDDVGNLTELNQRNKHWEEVQRTFVAGEYLNVSQFDNQKYGNQKTTDGDKLIFDSGYAYYPILYFTGSCNGTQKLYFENLRGSNSYQLRANNNLVPRNISGSSGTVINYPLKSGNVYNIFENITEGSSYYTTGTSTNFPTYSVQESGDHRASAAFDLYITMSNGGNVTWSFGFYDKNNNVIGTKQTEIVDLSLSFSGTATNAWTDIGCTENLTDTLSGIFVGVSPINISGTNIQAGDNVYYYGDNPLVYTTFNGFPTCTLSTNLYLYSKNAQEPISAVTSCECSPEVGYPTRYSIFSFNNQLYDIPGFTTNTSGRTIISFNKSINPISNLNVGDKIVPKFILEGSSTSDFTASLSQGSLQISSLAVATGYASTVCSYFNSSSLSASIANNDRSTITFSNGISNFHNNDYLFVPNPLTGSGNSLYESYGDVDYKFNIKPYDIIVTYLSDNTYVESRVLKTATSGSSLQVTVDTPLSTTYYDNLVSSSFQSFLILSRVEDETNTYLTFKKRPGSTSYGFIIPQNISAEVLDNIDTITKEVKQKLLSDQSTVTINTF